MTAPHFPTLVLAGSDPHPGTLASVLPGHLGARVGAGAAVAVRSLADLRRAGTVEAVGTRVNGAALRAHLRQELEALVRAHAGAHPAGMASLLGIVVADLADPVARRLAALLLPALRRALASVSLPEGFHPRSALLLRWPAVADPSDATRRAAALLDLEHAAWTLGAADAVLVVAASNYRGGPGTVRWLSPAGAHALVAEQVAVLASSGLLADVRQRLRGLPGRAWMTVGRPFDPAKEPPEEETAPWAHFAPGWGSRDVAELRLSLGGEPRREIRVQYGFEPTRLDGAAAWSHAYRLLPDDAARAALHVYPEAHWRKPLPADVVPREAP